MSDNRFSESDKIAFLKDYAIYRNSGQSQKKAYDLARHDAAINGRPVPAYGVLKNWIRNGAFPSAVKTETETSTETNTKTEDFLQKVETEETETMVKNTEEKLQQETMQAEDYLSDAAALKTAKAIIRLYRLRDETAVDEICDILLPVIGGLD